MFKKHLNLFKVCLKDYFENLKIDANAQINLLCIIGIVAGIITLLIIVLGGFK